MFLFEILIVFLIFIVILLPCKEIGMANEREKFEKLNRMCQFLAERTVSRRNATENIAIVTVGELIGKKVEKWGEMEGKEGKEERTMGGGGETGDGGQRSKLKSIMQSLVNPSLVEEQKLREERQNLEECTGYLARKTRNGSLKLKIEEQSAEFEHFLLNGRPFATQIIFYSQLTIEEKFFVRIIQSALSPFTTKDSIIEDIGIGTGNLGKWSKEILKELLVEEYFVAMKYERENAEQKPHWKAEFSLLEKRAKMHFCQWPNGGYDAFGQRFRMKIGEEKGFNWVNWIETTLNGVPAVVEEICF